MADLKTNYKDDILDETVNTNRTFNIRDNQGNLLYADAQLEETTVFEQEGDTFGAQDINDTNEAVNNTPVVGSLTIFAGSVVPAGYLLCDGREVSRETYSRLYAVLGDTWGAGDGSTTFNIPDMREVAPVGIGQSGRTEGAHDVFTLGEFKDDQLQSHKHTSTYNYGNGSLGSNACLVPNVFATVVNWTSGSNDGRSGTVTRGKRIGVNYIIKY